MFLVYARSTLRSRVCEAFWALSRNAEWVMHPVQAWGRQMNYNISFSRPYIPTDRAYWRGLIAFNSLLVQSCNVNADRGRHVLAVTPIAFLSVSFSSIDPPDSPPGYSCALSRRYPSSRPLRFAQTSPRCRDYYYFVFLFARRRDRLTLMQPPIVRGRPREVLGSRPVARQLARLHVGHIATETNDR